MVLLSKLAFAFSAGAVTFFSPCSYPLLPGYIAYFLGDGEAGGTTFRRVRRGLTAAVATSAGFFLVYGLLAGAAISIGSSYLSEIVLLEPVVGVLLVVAGALMALERAPRPRVSLPERRRTLGGFLTFGVVYAAAAAGCTAPLFIGLTGVALSSGPLGAFALLGSYALGMSVLIVVVTVSISLGRQQVLDRFRPGTGSLHRIAGVGLVVAGVAQLYWFLFELGGLTTLGIHG